ncbi:hypothetical protein [Microcoleus sp. herbarium12]|uniref:hypothetical protein n=1 Tax=Microcoleus sp. herbarium12 TaxID=3055437 RepID=UPI002FD24F43
MGNILSDRHFDYKKIEIPSDYKTIDRPSGLLEGRSLFFYRRWTQINTDARRAIARWMNYERSAL